MLLLLLLAGLLQRQLGLGVQLLVDAVGDGGFACSDGPLKRGLLGLLRCNTIL